MWTDLEEKEFYVKLTIIVDWINQIKLMYYFIGTQSRLFPQKITDI